MSYPSRKPRRPLPYPEAPDPAPGTLHIVQAFVNTEHPEPASDELASPAVLSDWLTRQGLLPAETPLSEADLARSLETRGGIQALILKNSGARLTQQALACLNEMLSNGTLFRLHFDAAGECRLRVEADGVDRALGRLWEIVDQAQRERVWPRLKLCANDACRRAFYDTSNNVAARWCSRRCANLVHGRARRRRVGIPARKR